MSIAVSHSFAALSWSFQVTSGLLASCEEMPVPSSPGCFHKQYYPVKKGFKFSECARRPQRRFYTIDMIDAQRSTSTEGLPANKLPTVIRVTDRVTESG